MQLYDDFVHEATHRTQRDAVAQHQQEQPNVAVAGTAGDDSLIVCTCVAYLPVSWSPSAWCDFPSETSTPMVYQFNHAMVCRSDF